MEERQTGVYPLPTCTSCDKIRAADGIWLEGEDFLQEYTYVEFMPTVCPECAKRFFPHLCKKAG